MIIKNEYVKIKGQKEFVLKNYIYDIYLQLITQAQYKKEIDRFDMYYCFLKFDEPFEDVEEKEPTDFDVYFMRTNNSMNGSENKLEVNYNYFPRVSNVYDTQTNLLVDNLTEFYGKKITAIGFGGISNQNRTIYSCVDTSSYSIRFEEKILFERKDIFMTDTVATDGYPENLKPFSNKTIHVDSGGHGILVFGCYPVLYSIGFGTSKGQMDEEFIIGEDVDIIEESNTSFGFNMRKGLEVSIYPHQNLYSKNGLFPMPLKVSRELQPSKKVYPRTGIVPLLSDYKYIIYKYRYYYFHDYAYDYRWTDDYFTINLPNETKGLFEIVTKIERSDV